MKDRFKKSRHNANKNRKKIYLSNINVIIYVHICVLQQQSRHRGLNGMNIGESSSMQRSERATRLNHTYIS